MSYNSFDRRPKSVNSLYTLYIIHTYCLRIHRLVSSYPSSSPPHLFILPIKDGHYDLSIHHLILKLLNNSLLLVMMRKIYFAQILAFPKKKNVGDYTFMLQPFIFEFLGAHLCFQVPPPSSDCGSF